MGKISLCVICGNEAPHVERFLKSFAPVIDELCVVRAIGNQERDETAAKCQDWAYENGVPYRFAEYVNGPAGKDWPHVDNFAAARQMAFDLGTCDRLMWADFDDVLPAGMAEKIRGYADHAADVIFFAYKLPGQHETCMRERLVKRSLSGARWVGCIHENYSTPNASIHVDPEVIFSHEPVENKGKDGGRNRRIITASIDGAERLFFQLGRECYIAGLRARFEGRTEDAACEDTEAERTLSLAIEAGRLMPEEAVEAMVMRSQIRLMQRDAAAAIELAWQAIRILPDRRHAWAQLAEAYLANDNPAFALAAARSMQGHPKPPASGMPMNTRYFGWHGMELLVRCNRAAGFESRAREAEENMFAQCKRRISLVHATRGRPAKAITTRKIWMDAAYHAGAVEHIFVVDADDAESVQGLAHYRRHVVTEPNGCVKAWNQGVAQTSGHVVIQLSDDWNPCVHWDEFIWNALERAAKAKGGEVENTPLVLQVSDGSRADDLLCIAIATRTRIAQQEGGTLFAPDYFGVFSDNEFSLRAFKDGVVVDAKNIVLTHAHPFFGYEGGKLDETYKRQNDPARYAEGEAIFRKRNPTA
jgi:hypothetical protein